VEQRYKGYDTECAWIKQDALIGRRPWFSRSIRSNKIEKVLVPGTFSINSLGGFGKTTVNSPVRGHLVL